MTTQPAREQRMNLPEMLSFARGLTLTRPWYFYRDIGSLGVWREDKIYTCYAKHELTPGFQFAVELIKHPKGFLKKREYCIHVLAEPEASSSQDGRRLWNNYSGTCVGGELTSDRRLKKFYESLLPIAADSGDEKFGIRRAQDILGFKFKNAWSI